MVLLVAEAKRMVTSMAWGADKDDSEDCSMLKEDRTSSASWRKPMRGQPHQKRSEIVISREKWTRRIWG
jgi:hypothetical protein